MGSQIVWTPAAAAEYDRLPADVRERIDAALLRLAVHGRGDVKRLRTPGEPALRLRVGDHRVLFALPAGSNDLLIFRVAHRSQAY